METQNQITQSDKIKGSFFITSDGVHYPNLTLLDGFWRFLLRNHSGLRIRDLREREESGFLVTGEMNGEGISDGLSAEPERKVEIRVRKNGRKDKVIISLNPIS